ncbi:hypothetical protein Tco_1125425 [Tanacetum coccineum]|uniref:Uncharacterized protein n=1 Tax=Tanacetum coccineum TaxID=301880 RepID=A0ABQ5JAC1_9ASTR
MDRYIKNALWLYWIRVDDEEVLTDNEFSDIEEENLREGNEIPKVFRIETDIFLVETPLFKEFKEFNHLLQIDVDVDEKPWLEDGICKEPTDDICHECKPFGFKSGHVEWPTYNWREDGYYNRGDLPRMIREGNMVYFQYYEWYEGLEDGDLKEEALKEKVILQGAWRYENRKGKDFFTWLKESFANQEWFDDHEPMKDDDDIGDLDDYLIPKDAPYYVDEEEEGFKERRSKLLGIPYKKPPTFKFKKFELIKYSFGPVEEYAAIREYEYAIWVRTEENVSHVY